MPRSKWSQKLEARLSLLDRMTFQERLISDWLCDLMVRRGYENFTQLSQYFDRCAVSCLSTSNSIDSIESPSASVLSSWFHANHGVKDTWVDSIAYVRRVDENLPATFSGDNIVLWIRNAPDPNIASSDAVDEPQDIPEESIVPTAEQIGEWTLEQSVTVMGNILAHVERLAAVQNVTQHKKRKEVGKGD
jgi:hypothetical protein